MKPEHELSRIELSLDASRKGLIRASTERIAKAEARAAELRRNLLAPHRSKA